MGVAMALLAGPGPPARAAEDGPVTFATVDWPPYYGSGLEGGGPIARVTRAAMAESGYDVAIEFTAWQRALKLVAAGQVDFMMGAYITEDRRQRFHFTEAILVTRDVVIARAETGVRTYDRLTGLSGYRIGVGRGWDFGPKLERARDALTLVESPDTPTLVRQLARGRIDMMIETEAVARTTIGRIDSADMDRLTVLDPAFRKSRLAHGIARDHPRAETLVAAFNDGLAALKRGDELRQLMPVERFQLPTEAGES